MMNRTLINIPIVLLLLSFVFGFGFYTGIQYSHDQPMQTSLVDQTERDTTYIAFEVIEPKQDTIQTNQISDDKTSDNDKKSFEFNKTFEQDDITLNLSGLVNTFNDNDGNTNPTLTNLSAQTSIPIIKQTRTVALKNTISLYSDPINRGFGLMYSRHMKNTPLSISIGASNINRQWGVSFGLSYHF